MVVVESTWWSPTQGTGLSESLGGGLSGGGFFRTPLGNSVGGRVLCHKVCSQCCKLAQEAYSRVRDKSRVVSAHRQRWGWRSGKNKADVVTQMNDRKQKRNKSEWDVAERAGEVLFYGVNSLMFQSKKVKELACFKLKSKRQLNLLISSNNKMNSITSYSKSTATTNTFILTDLCKDSFD